MSGANASRTSRGVCVDDRLPDQVILQLEYWPRSAKDNPYEMISQGRELSSIFRVSSPDCWRLDD